METSNSNSVRRKKHRLPIELYSLPGVYFVTICTHQRQLLFGKFNGSKLSLTVLGILVEQRLIELPKHHPSLELDHFVVMPNHLHALLQIRQDAVQSESIPNVINQFKSSVTRLGRKLKLLGAAPIWQPGFWDHIVRDETDYLRIREYIINNPEAWHLDIENRQKSGKHAIYAYLETFTVKPPTKRFSPE